MRARERRADPRWLDICRHHIRGEPAPFIVVLQHHLVPASSRIAAPLMPARASTATLLAPQVRVEGAGYDIMLLELASVPLWLIGETAGTAEICADAIGHALDAIFRGYPVGLPA